MELRGTYHLPAGPAAVWAALSDTRVLFAAIPGCQQVEPLPNGDIRIIVAVDVGPVSTVFTGQARLVSADPPRRATISGEGRGRPAGSAQGQVEVLLAEESVGTVVSYAGTVSVGGKLGELDSGLVLAKAKGMADEFFASLSSWLRREDGGFVDRLDHAPAGVPILGDEPSERVVEDPAERAMEVVREVEEEIEVAAARNVLGGPMVWGFLVVMVMVLILAIGVR